MSSLYYRVQNGGWWLVLAKYSHCYGKAIIMILFSIILHYEARSRYAGDIAFLLSQYHISLTFKGLAVSLLTLFFDIAWVHPPKELLRMFYICFMLHAPPSVCRRLDFYSSFFKYYMFNIIWPEKEHILAFKSMRNMCLAYGLCVCFHILKTAICMGLWDTFPCIAMRAHPVHPGMVTGKMLNKWSIPSSASSWIQIFTNGFPECNLSKWTVIIILDPPHP